MVRVYYNGDKSGSCCAAGRSLLCLRSAGLRLNLRFSYTTRAKKMKSGSCYAAGRSLLR